MKPRLFTSNEQGAHTGAARTDPAFTPFVTASAEELRYAERLRERLRERLLKHSSGPTIHWTVGAD
jgi:hypothetical protein